MVDSAILRRCIRKLDPISEKKVLDIVEYLEECQGQEFVDVLIKNEGSNQYVEIKVSIKTAGYKRAY